MQDNQLVIYQIENGEIRIEVQVYNESVWLSLNQMANIFGRDKSVISKHLKNIFKTEELDRHSTVAKFAIVQQEGEREIKRWVEYYNLDAILSVGYRVNSKRGIQFRQWASKILKDYLIQGYSVNKDKVIQDRLDQLRQTVEFTVNYPDQSEFSK
ncbi:RhuM family virulence protein [Candidatus Trichorickettsia mobilis]|uniref:RhuM family virulence protein n=1 Tax=Candidatus Trichorickettsia mobilis TaxID=1346319 RepID=A0ABZ0UVS7_9RICK|nr:RhuM family protein [Candidatus Trichorickettsia mobilis]WPY01285.1 RhuM family virulence protein [Candidatus Trichorickettsia mobilis]